MSDNDNTPDEYLCPISKEIMTDPVVAADGHTYQRNSILDWFSLGKRKSPLNGTELSDIKVLDNITLKKIIRDYQYQLTIHSGPSVATSDINSYEKHEMIHSLLKEIDKLNSSKAKSNFDINSSQGYYTYSTECDLNKNTSLLNSKTKRDEDFYNMYGYYDQFNYGDFGNIVENSTSVNSVLQKNKTSNVNDDPNRKTNLKNNKFLENKSRIDFESYLKETLKYICGQRGLPIYGNKQELISRIMEYKKDLIREDANLRNLIENRKLEFMTNDDLDDLLLFRSLKFGNNKSEKIYTLKDYINKL